MLLIVFLGLISKVVLVLGDCNLGTPTLHDFDWSRFSGPRYWYFLKHSSNETEYEFDCVRDTYSFSEGNKILVSTLQYVKSEHVHRTIQGNFTNLNSNGYYEYSSTSATWNGAGYIIAVDYDRYHIGKYCSLWSNEPFIYVMYRSLHPDQETVNEVNKAMQTRNIDASQMVNVSTDHCPSEESSAAGGSSA